jgi:hypothetical protein
MMTDTAIAVLKFRKSFYTPEVIKEFFGTFNRAEIQKMSPGDFEWCLNSLANAFGELCMETKLDTRAAPFPVARMLIEAQKAKDKILSDALYADAAARAEVLKKLNVKNKKKKSR